MAGWRPTYAASSLRFVRLPGNRESAADMKYRTVSGGSLTHDDKLAANYLAFIQLASIGFWLRVYEFTALVCSLTPRPWI